MKKLKKLMAVLLVIALLLPAAGSAMAGEIENVNAQESLEAETETAAEQMQAFETETDITEIETAMADTKIAETESAEAEIAETEAAATEIAEIEAGTANYRSEITQLTETYVNPLYEDVIDVSDLRQPSKSSISTLAVSEYYTSMAEAGVSMRNQMKERQETIEVGIQADAYDGTMAKSIAASALVHTGNPIEGDYLRWQYGGWRCSISYYSQNNIYYITFIYTVTYYTTANQEQEMDAAVDDVLNRLNLDSKTNYEKVQGIYDYICDNVVYDYDNLNDSSYDLKYTAYAALINKTSVCQGYALLFYRMALELGVDARIITGIGGGGCHAWNIVQLRGSYYNLDTTWDAGSNVYRYYLRCEDNFYDHTRDSEYTTDDFNNSYPMGTQDYQPVKDDISAENPFIDVEESDYYYDAVMWAYDNNITSGTDEVHFKPNSTCTRAQVVTFLWRANGEPEPETSENPFVDVKTTDYYYKAIMWAYENGITAGKDATHFQPSATVTRIQFVTLLWREAGEPEPTIDNPFVDIPNGHFYTTSVLWAYENGITAGKDATHFQPETGCTRGQVVTFMYRAYHRSL